MTKTNHKKFKVLYRLPLFVFVIGFIISLFPIFQTFATGNIFKVANAEIISISDEATADISSFDESTIYSKVVFHHINDEVTYKIRILNSSSEDYTISSITDDNASPYISYIYDAHDNYLVSAGEAFDFEVTAKYTTGVTDMNERVSTSTVKFFINFAGEEETIDVLPIVPNTGKNMFSVDDGSLGTSLVFLSVFSVGLIGYAVYAVLKHRKSSKIVIAIAIVASAITIPTIVNATTTEINVFTITTEYHLMDKLIIHNGDEDTIIDYGTPLKDAEIDDPEAPGQEFVGWEDEEGNLIDPEEPIKEDTTIIPRFASNQYTITFDTAGGSNVDPITQDYGTNVTAPADPTKTGYTFAGWNPEVPETMPAENITVTAQWTVNQYTITFDTAGGSSIDPVTQDFGTNVTAPADPTKAGYTFAGWTPEVPATMPAENITVTAQWTVNQYTITFDTAGGSEISPITQDYNTGVTAPANPTKTGYTFAGWNPEIPETMPAENITVTAQWTVNQYTITFDTDGGSEVAPITQDYGTNVTAPANPTRTGYTFAGWTPEIPATMPAENVTVVAQWSINQYTITFDTAGGSEVAPITQDYNTEVEAPADPTRAGYTFAGWNPEIPETMPAENTTITAQWNANQITIHFDKNNDDATGTMEDLSFNYDAEQNLPSNNFSLTDYYFGGWNTEADGSGTSYANGASVKNINTGSTTTLYAQWIDCPGGNVCYKPNGATTDGTTDNPSMGMQAISNGATSIDLWASNFRNPIKGENNKKAGFAGWNTKADGTGTSYGPNETISITTGQYAQEGLALYAMWVESAGDLQSWTGCNALNTGDVTALTDTRDGETYAIAKLADGNCWMMENLRLNNQYTTSAEDTAKAQGYNSSFIGLADSETANFTNSSAANSLYSIDGSTSAPAITGNNVEYRFPRYNNQNISSPVATMTNWNNNLNTYNVGNYYTWAAAIADTSDYASETHNTTSICPASWSIPIGGQSTADNSFGALSVALGGPANGAAATDSSTPTGTEMSRAFRSYPNNFIYSGGYYSTSATGRGSVGFYWSSTASGMYRSDHLKIASSHVYPGTDYSYKGNGRSIRCIMSSAIITFDKNAIDATGEMANQEVWPGVETNLNANTFTREHYAFSGWNTAPDGSGTAYDDEASITVDSASPITLYAQWAVTPYTIIFNKNAEDVTGEMANQSVSYGQTVNLTANAYSRESADFVGWNTKADGAGTTYANEAAVKNLATSGEITLYAQWNGFINYQPNASDVEGTMGHQPVSDNTNVTLLASNFSRTGYGFAGWNTKSDYSGTFYGPQETITAPVGASKNGITLYAVWVASAGSLQDAATVGSICNSLVAAPTDGTASLSSVSALTDSRDNNTYAIAKLADGKCWMIENLRLEAESTRTPEKQALAQGYGGQFIGLADAEPAWANNTTAANSLYYSDTQEGTASVDIGATDAGYRFPRYNHDNTNSRASNPTTNNAAMYSYGNYYTWAAMIADTDAHTVNNQIIANTSICPSGWHLPTGGGAYASDSITGVNVTGNPSTYREFYNLGFKIMDEARTAYEDTPNTYQSYYSSATTNTAGDTAAQAFRKYPNNFIYSGAIFNSLVNDRGNSGSYWSSATYDRRYVYIMNFNTARVIPGTVNSNKYGGMPARCVASSALVSFNKNATDATGEMAAQELLPGVATNLTVNTFTREHYAFSGWNTAPDGSGTAYDDEASITVDSASPITLYAQWAVTPYTIVFDKNSEEATGEMASLSVPYGETISLTANAFTRESYYFGGWNTAADGSGTAYADKASVKNLAVDGEVTLYAHWMECPGGYVCYKPNGATADGTAENPSMGNQAVNRTATSIKLLASNFKNPIKGTNSKKAGFAGWNTKADGTGTSYGPNETISIAAGQYAQEGLALYAMWVESAGDLQSWTGCSALGDGAVTALTDNRDNNTYAVAKLADGNCWMIENLRLADKDDSNNAVILSATNTNAPALPLTNVGGTTSNSLSPSLEISTNAWCTDRTADCINASRVYTGNTETPTVSADSANHNIYSYGNYYNWYSVTAGNNSSAGDICPAGWHLPYGGSGTGEKGGNTSGGFYYLGDQLGIINSSTASNTLRSYPNNFVLPGALWGSAVSNKGVYGFYSTNTPTGELMYSLRDTGSSVNFAGTNERAAGLTVRCVTHP